MRKIFLLLLLPSLGAVQMRAIGGNSVPKEMVTPYGGPDIEAAYSAGIAAIKTAKIE